MISEGCSGLSPFHSPFLSFMASELVGWLVSLLFWFPIILHYNGTPALFRLRLLAMGRANSTVISLFFGILWYLFGGYSAIAMYFPRWDCFYNARCWGWKVLFGIYLFSCLYINGLLWGSKREFFFLFPLSIMYER